MASREGDWTEILKPSYSTYKCEEEAYIEISKITIDNEIALEYLYDNAVRANEDVCSNLRQLYDEAINGFNKDVRRRMLSRMSNFKRIYGYESKCYVRYLYLYISYMSLFLAIDLIFVPENCMRS